MLPPDAIGRVKAAASVGSTATVKQEVLRRAAARAGREELAKALRVPPALLDAWLSGHASMPDRKFLMLADLLDKLTDAKPKRDR